MCGGETGKAGANEGKAVNTRFTLTGKNERLLARLWWFSTVSCCINRRIAISFQRLSSLPLSKEKARLSSFLVHKFTIVSSLKTRQVSVAVVYTVCYVQRVCEAMQESSTA